MKKKKFAHSLVASITFALCLLGIWAHLWAEEAHRTHPKKTITTVRVSPKPPKIDGVLDDKVWQYAPEAELVVTGDAIPNKLGGAHGIYNHTQDNLEVLNMAVCMEKGKFDSTDLLDDLSGR